MERTAAVGVIPARFGSTRFPGKPLALIHGEPMIVHVVRRAQEAGCFALVAVATDDERIATVVERAGARAVMTGDAASGTDRVAQAARSLDAGVVVNVQGDEPALPPASLRTLVSFLVDHPEVPMATLALPAGEGDLDNPTVVKVVCDARGRALYFSRSLIPFPRNLVPGIHRKHVGLYGFQREALLTFSSWPECELERCEGLEQLRALHNGMPIQVLEAAGDSVAVDVPDDIARAEAALERLGTGDRGPGTEERS